MKECCEKMIENMSVGQTKECPKCGEEWHMDMQGVWK